MKAPSGFSPFMGLIAALLVLVAGTATALTRDDDNAASTSTSADAVSGLPVLPRSPSGSGEGARDVPTSTLTTLETTTTASTTTTTVRPVAPAPENAVNGLWSAYTLGDRGAASRFATREVIDALFSVPFSGDNGEYRGCVKRTQSIYDCKYSQASLDYAMVAMSDATGGFKIVQISSTESTTTTSSAAPS